MDLMAETIGNATDDNFFVRNSGKGKKFPGSPTCEFKGKYIPCFCRWIKKRSITAEILTDILATLEHMGVFNRKEGATPSHLIYGHRSSLEM